MKRLICFVSALVLLCGCFAGFGSYVFANDSEPEEETYVFTGTVYYSRNDPEHNEDTYRIEFWTDEPEKPISKSLKIENGNDIKPKFAYQYKWTVTIPYKIRCLYVDIYYKNTLKKSYTIDSPASNLKLPTQYLFDNTEPAEETTKPTNSDQYWKKVGDKWYFYNKGKVLKGWWSIDGIYYFFDKKDGYMHTGWFKDGGLWYYLGTNGKMVTGWQKVGGVWYYFNKNGAMLTGWQKLKYDWYYFDSSGAMKTGWLKSGGQWYYFQSSGAMKCGWQKVGGYWYYFRNDGSMVANAKIKTASGTYRFNASGVCLNP